VTPTPPGRWPDIAERTGKRLLDLAESADLLRLPVEAVRALATAGYLKVGGDDGHGGPWFSVSDLKGFVARNADGGHAILVPDDADPTELLEALEGRSAEMAKRALGIFQQATPEATIWTAEEQQRFVDQSTARFEAILAVTRAGDDVDESLVEDLRDVGASAAWAGSPLPQLLVVLRISRDLVVQTAVEIAEVRGQGSSQALALLLTRVLPALDRLTDALAQGYWAAVIGREEDERARYEHLVEQSSDGIYELDVTGRLTYANPSLQAMVGQSMLELEGARLEHIFQVLGDGGAEAVSDMLLLAEHVRAKIVVTPDAKGRINTRHPLYRGSITSMVSRLPPSPTFCFQAAAIAARPLIAGASGTSHSASSV